MKNAVFVTRWWPKFWLRQTKQIHWPRTTLSFVIPPTICTMRTPSARNTCWTRWAFYVSAVKEQGERLESFHRLLRYLNMLIRLIICTSVIYVLKNDLCSCGSKSYTSGVDSTSTRIWTTSHANSVIGLNSTTKTAWINTLDKTTTFATCARSLAKR